MSNFWKSPPKIGYGDDKVWIGNRSDGISFYSRHREYLETFLDDRCHCLVGYRCEFHMDESLFEFDQEGACLGMKHDVSKDRELWKELRRVEHKEDEILRLLRPRLSFIKISHGEKCMQGPITLAVGAKSVERVLGFDQNGAPFAIDFTANPVTWSIDQSSVASSTPESDPSVDDVVGVSSGVANLNATCGGFTDTETVTVTAVVSVLSSIKIDSTPA